jgi:transposase
MASRCWSRACCGRNPFSGHLFVFRGRKANLIKIVFWDGTGLCLFTKRLEHGVFLWPSNVDPGGTLMLNPAQLSMLIDGVDWRAPERSGSGGRPWRDDHCGRLTHRHVDR